MSDCVFCDLVAGVYPVSIAYEDDVVLADMDEETGMHLFRVTMRLGNAIRKSGVRCEGVNLFLADGEAAFQEVFHLHMHVFPRFEGDTFKIDADWSVHPPRE